MASRILRRQRTREQPQPEKIDSLATTHRNLSFGLEETAPSEESECGSSDLSSEGGKASEGTAATAPLAVSLISNTSSCGDATALRHSAPDPSCTEPRMLKGALGVQSASLSAIDASTPLENVAGAPCKGRSKSCSSNIAEPLSSSCSSGSRKLRSSLKVDRRSLEQSVHSVGLSHHGRNRAHFATDDSSSKDGTVSSGPDKSADISSLGVSFHSVEVRQYSCELGDNPSVSFGPPISIGWDYDESTHSIIPVDEYEEIRGPERRSEKELVLPRAVREDLVHDSGFSRKDIASAVRQIEKDKRSRRRTVHNIPLMKFDESLETAGRKLKRVVLGKKKDKALFDEWNRQKVLAEAMIKEENEASAALDVVGDEGVQSAMAAALSPDEEQALWNTVSTKAEGTTKSFLTSRLPGRKATAIVIEEDSTHRGARYRKARASAA